MHAADLFRRDAGQEVRIGAVDEQAGRPRLVGADDTIGEPSGRAVERVRLGMVEPRADQGWVLVEARDQAAPAR